MFDEIEDLERHFNILYRVDNTDFDSYEDDIVLDGDMFEIEMPTDEDNGSTPTAREESRVLRLGFETRNRIANLHFGRR